MIRTSRLPLNYATIATLEMNIKKRITNGQHSAGKTIWCVKKVLQRKFQVLNNVCCFESERANSEFYSRIFARFGGPSLERKSSAWATVFDYTYPKSKSHGFFFSLPTIRALNSMILSDYMISMGNHVIRNSFTIKQCNAFYMEIDWCGSSGNPKSCFFCCCCCCWLSFQIESRFFGGFIIFWTN